MIAIFSTEGMDVSTDQVMAWIIHLGGACLRINGEALPRISFSFELSDQTAQCIQVDGQEVDLSEIGAIWYRRTGHQLSAAVSAISDSGTRQVLASHLAAEMKETKRALYGRLSHARWVSHSDTCSPNKFTVLQSALALGLTVPKTIITTRREALMAFAATHGPLIVKPISEVCTLPQPEGLYTQFTTLLDPEMMDRLPPHFFPILAQERVVKSFEIRCFYFFGEFYAMAIFSQSDAQTRNDFRVYNYDCPSRTVPYLLDADTQTRIRALMKQLRLDTGSLDFMKGEDGKLYFLEVNPVGQFGMVSHPCNYQLERRIAQFLIEEDQAWQNQSAPVCSPA